MAGKIYDGPATALDGLLFDGMTVMSGGLGLSGNPENLAPQIRVSGVQNPTLISHKAGADGIPCLHVSTRAALGVVPTLQERAA